MKVLFRFIGYLFALGALVFVVGAAAAGYLLWSFTRDLPSVEVLKHYEPPVMTRIHAADGQLVAEYAKERRLYLPVQAIPERVKAAFISAEDRTFYEHGGLDFAGIVQAVITNLENLGSDRRPVGASTITQQVAKNFLLSNKVALERKIREALLALKIERTFTKDEILGLYLNDIYLGLGAYGVAAAALVYFDKSVHELSIAEAAYLAALPKAPANYHPFRHHDRAVERRNWVIDQMQRNGYISAEQAEQAKAEPLKVTPRAPTGPHLPASEYFAEEVRRELMQMYGEEGLYAGGLSVRTTLDPKLQVEAQKALRHGLEKYDMSLGWRGPVDHIDISGDWGGPLGEIPALSDVGNWHLAVVLSAEGNAATIGLQPPRTVSGELSDERQTGTLPFSEMKWAKWATGERKGRAIDEVSDVLSPGDVIYVEPVEDKEGVYRLRQVPEVEGALVAMDPYTGRVLAMVGGFSFAESQFNRATQAMRQPGSSFKPFIYSAALDNGYTPASVVLDAPVEVRQPNGSVWRPDNYEHNFLGPATLRTGIERSRNLMTVRLAQDMGMPLIAEYARRFGIYDDMPPVLSMSLGAGETTLMRMTTAYAIIANGGRKITPTLIDRIQDRYGRTIYRHDQRICEGCQAEDWNGQPEPELVDKRQQVLDPLTDYQITSMLEGVVQRGTATVVKAVGKPIAGKTGTTNDYKDAWFVGFSPDLVAGVYIGYDQPRQMGRNTGGALAAPVFTEFMKAALADRPPVPFKVPKGISLIPIDRRTGMRARAGDPNVILEAFKPGQQPADYYSVIGANDDFYDPQGSYGQPPGVFVQQPGPYGQQQPGGWVQQGPYAQQPPGLYGRQPQGPRPPGALQPLTDATGRPVLDRWGRPVMVSPEAQRAVRSGTGGLY